MTELAEYERVGDLVSSFELTASTPERRVNTNVCGGYALREVSTAARI